MPTWTNNGGGETSIDTAAIDDGQVVYSNEAKDGVSSTTGDAEALEDVLDDLEKEELFGKDIAKIKGDRRWKTTKPYVVASAVILATIVALVVGFLAFRKIRN